MKKGHVAAEQDDRWLDRLLQRRAAAQHGVQASDDCLDSDTLAAWADHALTADARDAAQAHVSTCPRCLALLAAIERTAPAVPEASARRAWLGWLVPLTVATTAVAIWVLIPDQQVIPVAREAVSTSMPPPSASPGSSAAQPTSEAPAPPPAEPPFARPAPQPALRDEDLSSRARLARKERSEERKDVRQEAGKAREKEISLGAASADNAAPIAAAPPAPPAAAAPVAPEPRSADALKESVAVTQERAFTAPASVESSAPGGIIRWRVIGARTVERSIDGGETWNRTSAPPGVGPAASPGRSAAARIATPDNTITAIRAVDAANASVTRSDGATFSTADGGVTWVRVQEKPAAPF
jgi:hypothetical protein